MTTVFGRREVAAREEHGEVLGETTAGCCRQRKEDTTDRSLLSISPARSAQSSTRRPDPSM
jgi:hypothetical protein